MSDLIKETHLIWRAAGAPTPCDTAGEPLPMARGESTRCARCGSDGGVYARKTVVSTNFVPTRNANRLRGYGSGHYCPACTFCAKTLRLRCISWFASEDGIRFWRTRPETKDDPRPDALATLLDPPKPPFVVGIPLYGIAHGGEAHWQRTWWPGEALPEHVLNRLQSKHVALYSRLATSRDRYPVQVDDQNEFVLERDAWLRARDAAAELVGAAVADGVHEYPAKIALRDLVLPRGGSASLARVWPSLTAPLRSLAGAHWWPVFCALFPDLETQHATT